MLHRSNLTIGKGKDLRKANVEEFEGFFVNSTH